MNVKRTLCIILLFLFLFSALTAVSAGDDDRSYKITQALIELGVEDNGLLHVEEEYDYTFKGQYNGVYRDIPLKSGESIDNISIWAKGAYPVLKEYDDNGKKHLKIYLYSDKEHTKKIRDCSVTIYISYQMKHVVTLFNDIGGLQYKLWGDEWEVPVENIQAQIYLPGDKNNTYFLNPEEYTKHSEIDGDTIYVDTNKIPKGEQYELLVLMPLDDFNDATYAKHVNENGKDQIIKNLNNSINERNFWNTTYLVLGLLSILSPIGALLTYLRYGREPKVNYEGIYERELPTDDSPEVINALIKNKQNIGTPDNEGFQSSIMNLIDRKVLKLNVVEDAQTETKDLLLDFSNVENSNLSLSEKKVINTLYPFAENETLNLSTLNSKLSSEYNAKSFMEDFDSWKKTVENEAETKKEEYFDDTGCTIIIFLGLGGILFGVLLAILGFLTHLRNGTIAIIAGILLIIFSIAILFLPNDIFGRWTESGRVFYLKWRNFKKFLEDNSLIKEHPPESIVIWKKYLIYGAALGVADEVYKAMKLQVPNISDYDDDIFRYHYYGGYGLMYSAYSTGQSSANPSSDSGGFGGFGGGSGGGGGGAF